MASPWCEAVLYSPDPPFLFGGGSGNETTIVSVCSHIYHGLKIIGQFKAYTIISSTQVRVHKLTVEG